MPQQNRPRPPQNPYYSHRKSTVQRKRARRKRIISFIVLLVLVVIMFFAAVFLAGPGGNAPAPSSQAPASVPPASTPSSVPPAASSQPPRPTFGNPDDPYYEAEAPVLFNRFNPIPDDYYNNVLETLADISDGGRMQPRAATAFLAMQEAAAEEGITLSSVSSFRSYETQTTNYNASISDYMYQGYSEEEATRLTEEYYAIPGTSEHEAGLAVDINSVEDSFEETEAFAWLQQHSEEYGFILRYHKDTTDVTHIAYEPWHYRYVGSNHAEAMRELNYRTLEEYTEYLNEE